MGVYFTFKIECMAFVLGHVTRKKANLNVTKVYHARKPRLLRRMPAQPIREVRGLVRGLIGILVGYCTVLVTAIFAKSGIDSERRVNQVEPT